MKRFGKWIAVLALAALTLTGCADGGGLLDALRSSAPETQGAQGSSSAEQADWDGETMTVGKLSFMLPEGWSRSEADEALALAPDYPEDSSNINVQTVAQDPAFSLYTAEMLEKVYDEALSESLGAEVRVDIDAFEKIKADGHEALRILLHYAVNGITVRQLQIFVDGEEAYTVTYTQINEADWMDRFEASGKTIAVAD